MSTEIYKSLVEELNAGKRAVTMTVMESDGAGGKRILNKLLLTERDLDITGTADNQGSSLFREAADALRSGKLRFISGAEGKKYLIEPYFPETRLIILGGGHIAKPLAEFGARTGFAVTVADDRPAFAGKERFPDAQNVICESFDRSIDLLKLNKADYVVIVTRGHRHDLLCLRQVLKHTAAYVGMIGSRRRVKAAMEQLLSEGFAKEQLDAVNSPIGLEIGAVTPEEIAIAIIAQVISFKRKPAPVPGTDPAEKVEYPDSDYGVIEELSRVDESPKAVVTVVSTKGSVPRKAGAKMLVYPDGRTRGSIGGGCSEGEVIRTALDIIKTGGFEIQDIDMTGYVAEDEGMVCGGVMQAVVEYYDGKNG